MTGNNQKVRAVFLAALMVLSVFAGTVAFAGTAAAATSLSVNTVNDVATGDETTSQSIDINGQIVDDGNTGSPSYYDTVVVNVSEAVSNGITFSGDTADVSTNIDGASSNTGNFQINTVKANSTHVVLDIIDDESSAATASDTVDYTVTLNNLDTTGASTTNGVTYDVSEHQGDGEATTLAGTAQGTFDIVQGGITSLTIPNRASGDGDFENGTSLEQEVAVGVTVPSGNTTSVTIDVSEARAAGINVSTSDAVTSGFTGVNVNGLSFDETNDEVTFTVADASDDGQSDSGTVTFDMDLSNTVEVDTDDELTYTATSDVGGSETTLFESYVPGSTIVVNDEDATVETYSVYAGETVTFEDTDTTGSDTALYGETFDLYVNGEFSRSLNTTHGAVLNYDTSNWESGDTVVVYWNVTDPQLATDDAEEGAVINVRDLGLSATISDTEIQSDESFDVTVESNSGGQDVEFQLIDSNGDDYDTAVTRTLNGSGGYTYTFDSNTFTDEDTGNYTVEVTAVSSGVTVETSTLTVTESQQGSSDFGESTVTDARGDIVEIPVTIEETDTATVTIGSADDGFLANATVVDNNGDGEVLLQFNTYAATDKSGNSPANVFSAYNADDVSSSDQDEVTSSDIDSNNQVSTLLESGDYDLEVVTGDDASVSADNVATLILEERSTDSLNSWTAPSGTSIADLEDVQDAVADESVTQSSEIANGDIVVHELSATGLEGALAVQNQANTSADFFALDGSVYNLTVNQTNPGANRDAYGLVLNETNTGVIADSDNDTYYVFFDTDSANIDAVRSTDATYTSADGPAVTPADDDVLQANFSVYADSGNLTDSQESVMTDYELVNAQVSSDADPVNVTNAAEQEVTGTATVAPGTELNLRVRSDSDVRPSFLKTATVTVQADGSWSTTFDFSEESVGDTFSVTSSGGHDNLIASSDQLDVDGNVVESVGTTTAEPTDEPTEEPTDEPTEEPTDEPTEEPTDEPTDEPTEGDSDGSGTSTPGFGVVVALTALLAAALLATRRN